MKQALVAIVFLFLALAPELTLANIDSGLYEPMPPANSAFVRFLNNQPAEAAPEARANGKPFGNLKYGAVSPYYVFPEGGLKTSFGKTAADFAVAAGNFYTVVLDGDSSLTIKKDPANDNQAKAQVILYNLSPASGLTLKTADGQVEIVPALKSGDAANRQINPVRVALAIYDGERKVKDLGPVFLERASSYSAFVLNDASIEWVKSTTNTAR